MFNPGFGARVVVLVVSDTSGVATHAMSVKMIMRPPARSMAITIALWATFLLNRRPRIRPAPVSSSRVFVTWQYMKKKTIFFFAGGNSGAELIRSINPN